MFANFKIRTKLLVSFSAILLIFSSIAFYEIRMMFELNKLHDASQMRANDVAFLSGSVNPLRTGHDTFASYGSGISKLAMVVANRLNTSTKLINSFQYRYVSFLLRKSVWYYSI